MTAVPTVFVALDAPGLTTDDLAAYAYWLGQADLLAFVAGEPSVGGVDDLAHLLRLGPVLAAEFGFRPGLEVTRISGPAPVELTLRAPSGSALLVQLLAFVRDWTATKASAEFAAARDVQGRGADDVRRRRVIEPLRARLHGQLAEAGVPANLRSVTAEFVEHAVLPIVDLRVEPDQR